MQNFKFRLSLRSVGVLSWVLFSACLFTILAASPTASAQIVLSVAIAPPELPVYEQPIIPAEGYIWTPGYWSYSDDGGYFWVPGTWVEPPEVGVLWTPGYWGWGDGHYLWNEGYWGPHVGFYGGVDYGFGYVGDGYAGGYWTGDHFFYNRNVNNINVSIIHNVYERPVEERGGARVSFNGGTGGISARPTAEQETFAHERHIPPVAVQQQHVTTARSDRSQFASVNHGRPAVAATAKPAEFKGSGVVAAKAAGSTSASNRGSAKSTAATRSSGASNASRTNASSTKSTAKSRTETKPAATREAKPAESKPAAKSAAKPRTE